MRPPPSPLCLRCHLEAARGFPCPAETRLHHRPQAHEAPSLTGTSRQQIIRRPAMTTSPRPRIDVFGVTEPDPDPAPPSQPLIPGVNRRLVAHPDHQISPP